MLPAFLMLNSFMALDWVASVFQPFFSIISTFLEDITFGQNTPYDANLEGLSYVLIMRFKSASKPYS
jgi:hypothetical protein